jgi:hypothetical protein
LRIRPHIAPLEGVEILLDGVDVAPVGIAPDFDQAVLLSSNESVAKVAVDDFGWGSHFE